MPRLFTAVSCRLVSLRSRPREHVWTNRVVRFASQCAFSIVRIAILMFTINCNKVIQLRD
jgi:hypothetical protein